MHALSLLLALAAAEAAVPTPAPVPEPAVAPAVVTPVVAPSLVSAPPPSAPPSAPAPVVPADATPAPPAAAAPSGPSPSPSPAAAEPPSPPRPPPPLSQGAVEKLGQGDRAFLERDYRNALFAYQDAVYLAPRSPVARVKLGRAYLALRYASRAIEQAELALAAEPASAEARRLLEEAKNPPPRPPPAAPPAPPATAPATAAVPAEGGAVPASARVYRFTPEPEPQPAQARQPAPSAAEARGVPEPASAAGGASAPATADGARTVAVTAVEGAQDPVAAPAAAPGRSARQRYREALALLERRDFARADEALTDAIAIDPRLAVAHAARASARFGLGRYREASTDYRAALALDPGLGTPLYGLAECYRVLGDARSAAEMYERYARSGAADVRGDLREIAAKRAQELR